MAQAKGANAQLLMGPKETVYGETPASPDFIRLPFISANIAAEKASIEGKEITSRRDSTRPGKGNTKAGGSVVVPVDVRNFGHWLRMILGDPATTGSDPYTHEFKVGNTVPSFPIEQGYTDINRFQLFNGCKANSLSLKLDAGADANLEATIAIEAAKETAGGSSADASPDAQLSLERFKIDNFSVDEGGATLGSVKAVDLTITNNLDTGQYLVNGGGVRGDLPPGLCTVAGNLTALFENDILLAKARNSTETSLKLGLSSGVHSLELMMNELEFGYKTPGITGPQGIVISLPFLAYFDNHGTDESAIKATLINDVVSYAA